jgi:uncharacterized protein
MSHIVVTRGCLDALGDSYTTEGALAVEEVRLGDDVFTLLEPLSFSVTLTNTGAGIVAAGSAHTRVRATCVRCLGEYESDVTAPVDGFYVRPEQDVDLPEEQEREHIVDERIDLEPAIFQAFVLELPFAPTCRAECPGLCPSCGADRNEGPCGCLGQGDASPFAVLREAFPPTASDDV